MVSCCIICNWKLYIGKQITIKKYQIGSNSIRINKPTKFSQVLLPILTVASLVKNFFSLLKPRNVHPCIHKILPLQPILSQMNRVNILTPTPCVIIDNMIVFVSKPENHPILADHYCLITIFSASFYIWKSHYI
jgi:hypothetical protein